MGIGDLAPPVRALYEDFKVSPMLCTPMDALRAVKEKRCSSYLANFMKALDRAQLMRAQTLLTKGLKL
jgi:hypothetical protein